MNCLGWIDGKAVGLFHFLQNVFGDLPLLVGFDLLLVIDFYLDEFCLEFCFPFFKLLQLLPALSAAVVVAVLLQECPFGRP